MSINFINFLKFIKDFVINFIKSGLNNFNLLTLPLNFLINFLPILIWLLIFKNANLIPNEIRPDVHVLLAKNLDDFIFNIKNLSSWISFILIILLSFIIYLSFYDLKNFKLINNRIPININEFNNITNNNDTSVRFNNDDNDIEFQGLNIISSNGSNIMNDDQINESLELNDTTNSNNNKYSNSRDLSSSSSSSSSSTSSIGQDTTIPKIYLPVNCIYSSPVLLLSISWIFLNFTHALIQPITTTRDLMSWFSYVLLHFLNPILTAVYLYVFQTQGALKYYSFALGLQNIMGVLTHLTFPNAPPWFIHLYGENATANYDMPGYAAGLTRVDVALGTHLNSNGFHKSPIVFGALPSLHSAMAVLSFFFICYYTRWYIPKILMFSFVIFQWWVTMYLDHHWRLDLFIGLIYSLISFTIFKSFLIKIEKISIKNRLTGNFNNYSTFGMRVFKFNFKISNFFDPYS
ncbi:unnamed protein product [[Candida] boidinii]|uniref:Unnamed protein product n=1 Tax=Candida boidinii TaxID=5477 RepID=A0ACB5TIT3_CANBO|nr:unnamed protein product [[Candida] boidinii]